MHRIDLVGTSNLRLIQNGYCKQFNRMAIGIGTLSGLNYVSSKFPINPL